MPAITLLGSLFTFLAGLFARSFAALAVQIGLQKALHVALAATWFALVYSFTAAAKLCTDSATGVCGVAASGFSGLSPWLKFGFSLVPWEALQIIGCLISLHIAGYAFLVMMKIIHHLSLGSGTGLAVRGGTGLR
jgi:hypothetical protein